MSKNKNLSFLIVCVLLVLSRTYDFLATYFYTPDLRNESNILVKIFDLDYTGLFFIQLALTSLVIFCYYIYLFEKYKITESVVLKNIKEFISFFHYGKKVQLSSFLYKSPKLLSVIYSIGYIVTYSLICIGFIVGTSTVFLIISEKYKLFYTKYGTFTLYTILILIVLYFSHSFYRKEYTKYSKKSNAQV
jgi:hypothetical protein